MVNNRFNLNKSVFRRVQKLYKKPRIKDDDESSKAVLFLNQDLIPDCQSTFLELNLARKLGPHMHNFTRLHFCVLSNVTLSVLKSLIVEEDVDAVAYNGMTPLHMALCINLDPVEVVKCLIDHGADVNRRMKIFQFTPLLIATYTGCHDVLKLLIESGADVDASNDEGLTPLLLASALGNKKMVAILIELGANVNCRLTNSQLTALHLASMKIDYNFLKRICQSDCEVNDENVIMEMKRSCIIENGREEIVSLLVEHGADLHAKDTSGKTAVHFAVQYENAIVEKLLTLGSAVNDIDNEGRQPLQYAIEHRQGCNLEWLLKYGADVYDAGNIDRLALRKTIEGDEGLPISLVFDSHINGIYELCKISVERSSVFQDLLENRILEYLVKLEAACLPIPDRSKNMIDEIGFEHYYNECLNEVERMKAYKIKNNVSLYDLLHIEPKRRARLIKKCFIPINLESKFPNYWDIFQVSFFKTNKKKLFEGKKFAWYRITDGEVPDIYVKNAPDRSNRTLNVMSSYWYRGG